MNPINQPPAAATPGDISPHILAAFRMMWDKHPSPVMLTRPNRTIVAVNEAARAVGIEPGRKCFTLCGPDKPCAACKANQAVRDDACARSLSYTEAGNRFVDAYWTPLAGVDGLFLHYANDITPCVREELLRPGCSC
ncbi:hypothetical protein [Nitratidesulfovibrio liaohensis]|uniref:hypothetical protein n=1 Tax=Nitratidesulfovibrio liaohensis TaxID=2604158 RepID=UPI0014241B89|nr:hypothetical protein [Nitratidesulfovibrio liaohensis]NHZ47671.1 hypothetical protein [Nitratidesulfovibrio liaohensis]